MSITTEIDSDSLYPAYPTGYVPRVTRTEIIQRDELPKMTPENYPENYPREKIHSHYFKDVSNLDKIDVYRVLDLFGVTHPCIQHAVKKLLVSGSRGGGKSVHRDIQEAIDSLTRYQKMVEEDS